ncbi:MAG: 23S rRNA pseudouridine synthase F, partial [Bacteroidetes bacterium]|nr:23S rRNA pseudouridine synthase F [Bacteroidota bacterium]
EVTKLKRTRIMNISLKNIPVGKWRNLSKDELNEIMKMVENSSKTEEASINTVPIKPKKHRYL